MKRIVRRQQGHEDLDPNFGLADQGHDDACARDADRVPERAGAAVMESPWSY
jgi:hypothetical protein